MSPESIDDDGARAIRPPQAVPGWITQQCAALLRQNGHALLISGPSGLGQEALALELIRAWLCKSPTAQGACGQCASCHGIDLCTHSDLYVLMPEIMMLDRGWPLLPKAMKEIEEKKRKPSKEIRVDAMRDAVEFMQLTSAQGRGKAVLVYPAERMNQITANTLLKSLEEPPGDVKFVLASEGAQSLLPTVRSRCMAHAMVWPKPQESLQWLAGQGVPALDAATLLRASGDRPQDVLNWLQQGHTAAQWRELPRAMQRGDLKLLANWSPPQLLEALQKLCHDVLAIKVGAAPRFFDAALVPALPGPLRALSHWSSSLARSSRTAEHPFSPGLMHEALVSEAKTALNARASIAN